MSSTHQIVSAQLVVLGKDSPYSNLQVSANENDEGDKRRNMNQKIPGSRDILCIMLKIRAVYSTSQKIVQYTLMESKRHVFMNRFPPFVGEEALEMYNSKAFNAKYHSVLICIEQYKRLGICSLQQGWG